MNTETTTTKKMQKSNAKPYRGNISMCVSPFASCSGEG